MVLSLFFFKKRIAVTPLRALRMAVNNVHSIYHIILE